LRLRVFDFDDVPELHPGRLRISCRSLAGIGDRVFARCIRARIVVCEAEPQIADLEESARCMVIEPSTAATRVLFSSNVVMA
jgi:hypothetical protein